MGRRPTAVGGWRSGPSTGSGLEVGGEAKRRGDAGIRGSGDTKINIGHSTTLTIRTSGTKSRDRTNEVIERFELAKLRFAEP